MLDPELIPTQLMTTAERSSIRIWEPRKPSRHWVLRFLKITLRSGGRMLWAFLRRRLSPIENARLVRGMLEELGGLWIKAGQLLSLRIDMFSREFCHELAKLQSQADGFTPAVARKIIEEDIGPIDVVFDQFEDMPFATASIGQIHRARLRLERVWVAVKVQRPYLKEKFEHDLKLIEWVVRPFAGLRALEHMRLHEAVWEIRHMIE